MKLPESYSDIIAKLYPFKYNELNKIQTPTITFQVTDDCNLCCSYCYQINKGHHTMSLDIAKHFIDLLFENNENTQQYIDTSVCDAVIIEFIGGEPFLEVELMDSILEYFISQMILYNHKWQYNWQLSISSNGTLYFKPKVQAFIKKWMSHLNLSISIDGNKKLHDTCRVFPNGSGSYDIAMAAVHHYTNILGGNMGSKMTLAPDNIMYTYEAVLNLINEKYTSIHLNCIFEEGWTEKEAFILYTELKKIANYLLNNNLEDEIYVSMFVENYFHPKELTDVQNWCGGNGSMISLDWKGNIYPCIRYMESSLGENVKPIIIGNVKDGIMTNAKCRNCINELKQANRINQSTEECINCPIAEGCAWCQAYNYQVFKDFKHRATFICIMHKARALANVYFWNKYYQKHKIEKVMKLYLPDNECLKIISQQELDFLKSLI